MNDKDENGVDRMERFRGYSQRFIQFSVADEVYRETLEYMKHLRNERDAMRQQRDEARRLYCVEMSRQSTNPTRFTPDWGANELGWDCFKEGGGA